MYGDNREIATIRAIYACLGPAAKMVNSDITKDQLLIDFMILAA